MQEGFILFVDELSCLAATPFLMNVKGVDGYNKNIKKTDFGFKVINILFPCRLGNGGG